MNLVSNKIILRFKQGKSIKVTSVLDKTYEDRTLPELNVSPTSSGLYVSGYDENGNRIYTWDRKLSMGYSDKLPEGLVEKRRKRWAFKRKRGNGTTYPGLYGDAADLAKAAELGIGTAMLAVNPLNSGILKVGEKLINNPITEGLFAVDYITNAPKTIKETVLYLKDKKYKKAALNAGRLSFDTFGVGRTASRINGLIRRPRKTLMDAFDKYAFKTKLVSEDGTGRIYEQLTPKFKYLRDRIFFNKAYKEARKNGQYPLTYKERRLYLQQLKNDYRDVKSRLIERRTNDYGVRHQNEGTIYVMDSNGNWVLKDATSQYGLDLELLLGPKAINYTSLEGQKFYNGKKASGFTNGLNHFIALRRRNSLLPTYNLDEVRGVSAHEADHIILQNIINDFRDLEEYTTADEKAKYGRDAYHVALNKNNEAFNDYAPITEEARGSWFGSPNEINSEMLNILELMKTTKSYRDLNSLERARVDDFMANRFGIKRENVSTYLMSLSLKGYFYKGGKINDEKVN